MSDKLYIDTLTEKEIARIEEGLRPERYSFSGFLGPNEDLKTVIYEDAETLRKLGVTHDQIADKLEYLVENPEENHGFKVKIMMTKGFQIDPFKGNVCGTYASWDIFITNQDEEQISFGGPIIGLIRNYQFFEGKEVSYRLDPEKAVQVLGLNKTD